jgi:hypothetical protein
MTDAIVRTQPEPGDKLVVGPPFGHVVPCFGDDRRRGHDIDAVDPSQVRTGHAKQPFAQIEPWFSSRFLVGDSTRTLARASNGQTLRNARWSPDGRRIAYVKTEIAPDGSRSVIETKDLRDGSTHMMIELSGGNQLLTMFQDYVWLQDGRVIYVMGEPDIRGFNCNLWQTRVDDVGRVLVKPIEPSPKFGLVVRVCREF